jgi:tartrate dehydratase beta subunit/fumarate hydratase class I family protein
VLARLRHGSFSEGNIIMLAGPANVNDGCKIIWQAPFVSARCNSQSRPLQPEEQAALARQAERFGGECRIGCKQHIFHGVSCSFQNRNFL